MSDVIHQFKATNGEWVEIDREGFDTWAAADEAAGRCERRRLVDVGESMLAEIDQLKAKLAHQDALLEQKRVEIYEEATNAVESYKRVTEIKTLLTYAYNSGYMAGHHDTVEGQFTDIHHADMRTYHLDEVADIVAEHDKAGKEAASVTITLSGCHFTENELLDRVMRNIEGANRYGTQRWVRVKDVFGCGSGVSHALCYRFGLDPDQDLKKR